MSVHEELKSAIDAGLPSDQIDRILQKCDDMECMECGEICCPAHHPFHFHHDGCPGCPAGDDPTVEIEIIR